MDKHGQTTSMVNGVVGAKVGIDDRGYQYGDGLFETIRYVDGRLPLLDEHLFRLEHSCQKLCIPYNSVILRRWIHQYLEYLRSNQLFSGAVKIIYTRAAGGRGYIPAEAPPAAPNVTFLLNHFDHQVMPPQTLMPLRSRLGKNPDLAGMKHLSKLEYVLAAIELNQVVEQAHESIQGLLLDIDDKVIETLHYNVFMVEDGSLLTPRLDNSGVAGVLRNILLKRVIPSLRITVEESDMDLARLRGADELFICNSVRGVVPVARLQNRTWSNWPMTRQLAQKVEDIWDGCIS